MKRYSLLTLILITLVLLTSCVTRQACERKFPTVASDSTRIITNTVTSYRDTTIYIHLAGDTVYKSVKPDGGVSRLSTPMATSYAWLSNGQLKHRLVQKDTTIRKDVKNGLKTTVSTTSKNRVVVKVVKQNYLTRGQRVWVRVGKVCCLLLVVGSLVFVYKWETVLRGFYLK